MNLAQRIQAKTDNGDTIIDFLVEVMKGERDDFKICHRLDAARLLRKYGWDEAADFIVNNPTEPSRGSSGSGSSRNSMFDTVLAKKIQESTDDGATVCRFLVNVMEGNLRQFKPHHRISAARELLNRGFGKHVYTSSRSGTPTPPSVGPAEAGTQRGREAGSHSSLLSTHSSTEGDKHESEQTSSHPSTSSTQTPQSEESPNHTDQSSDDEGWAAFWEEVTPILDEDDRRKAEQQPDPDNPPYVSDLSVFNEAWDNSEKWFYEWKNSLDPEEYEAIVARELAEFNAMIDNKIERRKQIKADRERREKEEAERQSAAAEEARAKAEAEPEEPPDPGPPTESQHKRKLMFELGESIYVDCEHPDCDLHNEDRSRWIGSVQYGAGPSTRRFF